MTLLDTDTFSMLVQAHPRVSERFRRASDAVALTVVSRIEVLQGRFASVVKAADGAELLRAQAWLEQSERDLVKIPIVPFDAAAAGEFDRLRQNRKIGRADLLISAIALAGRATLVSRNLRHFRQVPGLRVENWAD